MRLSALICRRLVRSSCPAAVATGLSAIAVNGTGTLATATCNTNGSAWAAEAPLKTTNHVYCVDSTGASKDETASIGAGYVCAV